MAAAPRALQELQALQVLVLVQALVQARPLPQLPQEQRVRAVLLAVVAAWAAAVAVPAPLAAGDRPMGVVLRVTLLAQEREVQGLRVVQGP